MAELAFVGLGLGDERGLSERALEVLRSCGAVFAEEYTAVAPPGTLERLSARIGRPVQRLGRAAVEAEAPILEALARHPSVALVVVGEEDDRAGGPLLTRRFLEELFRAAPCPVIALRS